MTARCGRSRLEQDLWELMQTEPIVAAAVAAGRNTLRPERDILLLMVREMAKAMSTQREMLKRYASIVVAPFVSAMKVDR